MISFIEGTLTSKHPTESIVAVGGVGIRCLTSLTTYVELPDEGEPVRLVTELVSRDDGIDLYGFSSEAERLLFRLLRGVSGVGSRMAQGILSGLSVEEFAKALATGDLVALTSIRGVGRKTAERLLLELKEKVPSIEEVTGGLTSGEVVTEIEETPLLEEAVLALRSLGYSAPEARNAVERALAGSEEEPTLESLVKSALTLTH
ncbi:Holliday junction branch migration protein RuvA [Candidatus Zixiibacteriota bacterium]